MAMTRNVGSEDADLAICNLAYRTSVLPRHTARRLALLEKAGLVDDEDRIVICQMLDDIVADNIAQGIGIPIPATKDRLLPPWTRIARRLGAHPTGLALLIAEQTFQKQACVPRNAFLPEQRTYPLLHFPKRRCPQCKRLFNRRCTRPRSSNHGCPWIQISSERATTRLVFVSFRNAKLTVVDFSGSSLSEVDFENANLDRVSFAKADIKAANFKGAELNAGVDFTEAEWWLARGWTDDQLKQL